MLFGIKIICLIKINWSLFINEYTAHEADSESPFLHIVLKTFKCLKTI